MPDGLRAYATERDEHRTRPYRLVYDVASWPVLTARLPESCPRRREFGAQRIDVDAKVSEHLGCDRVGKGQQGDGEMVTLEPVVACPASVHAAAVAAFS
jgi:hypothetical protein